MEVCRWSSWLLPLLGVILLAEALQGVQGEVEIEGPSESECRPYIEKALRNLETVGDATVGQDNEDASSIDNVSIEEKQSDERSVEISEPETETHESQETGTTTSDEVTQTNDQDVETEESTESVTEEGTQEIAAEENITGEEKEPEEDTHESESVENLEETAPEETTQQEESSEKISVETVEEGESIEELPTVEEASSEKTNDEKVDSLDESTEQTVEKSAETTENKESDESKEQDGTEKEETQSIEADDDATDEQSAASEEKKTESDEQVTKDDDEQDEQESKETEGESETREKRSEEQSVEDEQTEETLAKEVSKEDNSEDTNQNEQSTETAEENETESSEKVNENDKASSTEEPNEEKEDKSAESDTTLNADEGDSNDTEAETTQSKEEKEAEETIDSKEKEGADETSEQTETVSTEDKEKDETTEDNMEGEKSDEGESGEENGEDAPEEDLINGLDVPKDLRPRDHVEQLLKLDREATKTEEIIDRIAEITLRDLKRLYDNAIKPLETLYKYRDLSNRHYGDAEIFSKPLILFMGPWSGGKSSIINYLLDVEYNDTALRTGAEPSPAYFNLLMYGEDEEVLDGTQLAADYTFSGLQKFGQGLEERLRGVKLPSKLLEKVNIVEIPGILEVRKQVSRVFPFNDACQWFIDRADIIFLVYDPSKLDVGPETEAILDQLKGREYQTRIVLNKADQVKPEELMRIQGALIWNISPLMSSPQPPTMYTTSLWSRPYEHWAPVRLLQAQERAFLRDLRSAVDKRIENKIASARRFAVRVRNHAKMVDCYLTTYYNHKSIFGNRKQVSDAIIDHPQDYHIYEGLSTLTNISRYDLPDPDVYRDFFRLNPLYEFQQLSATCTYFRGCPINKLDIAIAYDLPELVGKHKRQVETALAESNQDQSQGS